MDCYVTRPQSLASSSPADPFTMMDPVLGMEDTGVHAPVTDQTPRANTPPAQAALTPDLLYEKLQNLLLQITHSMAVEVGKIAAELRGEIAQIGECTGALKHKFDDVVNYVQVLEEENHSFKHSVSQLQLQQEDLENRER